MTRMRRGWLVRVGLAWLAASCGGGAKPGGTTTPTSAPGDAPTLIVAGEQGVQEIGLDGRVLRTLTATPSDMPRFLPGSTDLLFVAREPALSLMRIGRDGTNERKLGELPASFAVCDAAEFHAGESYELSALGIQSDDELVVDAAGTRACFWLMDRNINMADVRLEVRVDLVTGKLAVLPEIPDGCPQPADAPPGCEPAPASAAPAPAADPPRVFAVEEGKLLSRENGQATLVVALDEDGEFTEEARSPSGRWTIITGHLQQGDYIYRDAYLLDRHQGTIHPLRSGAWAPALTPAQLPRLDDPEVPTVSIVGESLVRWLPGLGRDVLIVDALLITPGQGAVELPGDLAY